MRIDVYETMHRTVFNADDFLKAALTCAKLLNDL